MNQVSAFIIYLTIFRLSIIAAGITSIVLGYFLFCKGIRPESGFESNTRVDASIGKSRISLINAAPGTCFALFGVIIISVMVFIGSPEMTLDLIHSSSQKGSVEGLVGRESRTLLKMRGDEVHGLVEATQEGRNFEEQGDIDNAVASYRKALNIIAEPMNNLAWLYQGRGEIAKALPLARMAVQLSPDDANLLDTLAEILFKTGNYSEALEVIEKAADLDPRFKEKLKRFREAKQES